MSSTGVLSVPEDSVDAYGLSFFTSSKDPDEPQKGIVYNPNTFAAGALVHIHPVGGDTFSAIYASRWHTATLHGGPQQYSSHSQDLTPTAMTLNTMGGVLNVKPLDCRAGYTTRVLIACISRSSQLFVLQTLDGIGHIQIHRNTPGGGLELQVEEFIPNLGNIVWNRGIFLSRDDICILGSDGTNPMKVIKKPWARVGTQLNRVQGFIPWTYQTDKGWSMDSSESVPLNISTSGPCSYAESKGRSYLSTKSGSNTVVYVSRGLNDPWTQYHTQVADRLHLQPHLALKLGLGGTPYITSATVTVGSDQRIDVAWDKILL